MTFRAALDDAVTYWEPRRLWYNLVLVAVVLACLADQWPLDPEVLTFDSVLILFILAVLANVAYCAAYIPDVFLQLTTHRDKWRRTRWLVLLVGILFAAALAYFYASNLFASTAEDGSAYDSLLTGMFVPDGLWRRYG